MFLIFGLTPFHPCLLVPIAACPRCWRFCEFEVTSQSTGGTQESTDGDQDKEVRKEQMTSSTRTRSQKRTPGQITKPKIIRNAAPVHKSAQGDGRCMVIIWFHYISWLYIIVCTCTILSICIHAYVILYACEYTVGLLSPFGLFQFLDVCNVYLQETRNWNGTVEGELKAEDPTSKGITLSFLFRQIC